MNVIEQYANQIATLNLDIRLFDPDGTQICPAEGTRRLIEFAEGCKTWFSFVDHIVCKQIISKTWKNHENEELLQGVIAFDVYYKVKAGEAKISAIQVIYANQAGKIIYINSFWDFSHFEKLIDEHPELKEVFNAS